jgi:hypothetical protein
MSTAEPDVAGEFPMGAGARHTVHLNPPILAIVTARAEYSISTGMRAWKWRR